MSKSMFIVTSFLCALFVTGCASVPMAPPAADSAAKVFKTDPSKANIYIYRNETLGAAVKMSVLLDNVYIGDTAAKTYIMRAVAPGKHLITSKSENDATLSLDAEAGFNYFIWQEVKMGMWTPRSKLHLVDEEKGKAGVEDCKLVQ